MSKWTWMVSAEDRICFDCEHMEGEGWTVVSIVLTNPASPNPYYKVFMRMEVPA